MALRMKWGWCEVLGKWPVSWYCEEGVEFLIVKEKEE